MGKVFFVISSTIILLIVLNLSLYFYERQNAQAIPSVDTPVTIEKNGSTMTLFPAVDISNKLKEKSLTLTRERNKEYVTDAKGNKSLVAISGLLEKTELPTDGVLVIEAKYEGVPLHFLGLLPSVDLIDNRAGQTRSLIVNDFLAISPALLLTIKCNILLQTSPDGYRCGAFLLQDSPLP